VFSLPPEEPNSGGRDSVCSDVVGEFRRQLDPRLSHVRSAEHVVLGQSKRPRTAGAA
jgi:hypothetical protein